MSETTDPPDLDCKGCILQAALSALDEVLR